MNKTKAQLRFKDDNGNDYPDWEVKKLGEVFYAEKGKGISKDKIENDGINECILYGELYTKYKEVVFDILSKTNEKDGLKSKVGDLLIPSSTTTTGIDLANVTALNKEGVLLGGDITVLRSNQNINNVFYAYYLSNCKKQEIANLAQGITIVHLYYSHLKGMDIDLPSLEEQTKIANFLSAIDEKIDNLQKELDELKEYKKGVMQAIFSNVNKNGGGWNDFQKSLKFKDEKGKDFPKWEKKKFGEVFTFRTTNSFSRENLNYEFGTIKNIHYGDIHTKFNSYFDITKEYVPFVNPEIELKKIAEDNYCREGDLIIADASEDYEDVGKAIEIVNLNKQKVLAGLHTIQARPNLSKMAIGFNGHLMKSENVRLQIKTIAQGSKVLSISATRLANISIDIPCLKEQTKIADFLSAIDEKVNITQNEMQHTQQYKKGLMQQLFALS